MPAAADDPGPHQWDGNAGPSLALGGSCKRAFQDFLLGLDETKSPAAVRVTAVSAPNEAIEQAFRLLRIELKNGSRLEGFKAGEDGNEVTLRRMGGATQKVSHGEIQSAGYIDGRSVTHPVAAGLQDLQVAEIVAYLRAFE